MTTQDILSEAQRLSVSEQIHLASQLMQLVEQSIRPSQQQIQVKKNTTPQPNSIDYLMQHPIPVSQYHSL